MSFNNLKLAELKTIAGSFGVDVPTKTNKNDVILLLEEEGISWQMYEQFSNVEKEDIKVDGAQTARLNIEKENSILIKMDRENFSYQIGTSQGIVNFTAEHPFIAVPESIAQEIFDLHAGFRPATPREVQEFYS